MLLFCFFLLAFVYISLLKSILLLLPIMYCNSADSALPLMLEDCPRRLSTMAGLIILGSVVLYGDLYSHFKILSEGTIKDLHL